MKKWQIVNSSTIKQFNNDEIIKILLANRGLKNKKEIKDFLNPPDPQDIKPETLDIKTQELDKAIKRIKKAIDKQESIIVYGDYDADGVCATAILWETLYQLGAKAMPYIPHRVEEGYGLSEKGIDAVQKEYDAKLIITVDHGITAWEKVEYGKKSGIDFIICDHHVLPEKLPNASAIVHTTQLCGAGVAWILARELLSNKDLTPALSFQEREKPSLFKRGQGEFTESLDLAAIATIADMVPLTGANRILVKYGLAQLNKTQRPGLIALMAEAGLKQGKIWIHDINFIIAPRLNAMGRIEHAMDSLRLLCTHDEEKARNLAGLLDRTNKERQQLTEETLIYADKCFIKDAAAPEISKLIFISHESYNQGIIGLVAGKLVEKYYRPAIVVSRGVEFSKASARSISGFNIIETIRKADDLLVDCGGHPMAAGFTVETKNLEILKSRLTEIVNQELDDSKLTRVLKIDCEVALGDLNLDLYERIKEFAPFGLGNPEPVFASKKVMVKDARIVGSDGKHLKLLISGSVSVPAVAFGMADLLPKLTPDKPVDIAYTLSLNEWNNEKKLELKIKDIKTED